MLLALSHNSTPVATNPLPTTAPNAPSPTPTAPASFFTPDGTAPTTEQCMKNISVACYSPEEMQQAFGLTSLYKQGYDGKGQTIVILGAGNAPTIQNDLKAFDKAWGLPDPPSFQVIQPFGPPVQYTCAGGGGDGLQLENTLDVEWSHAMAPGANIILLIGSNSEHKYFPVPKGVSLCGLYDLEDGVAYVTAHHLGNVVSISYGGSELGARTDTAVDKANEKKEYDAADAIFKQAVSAGITVLSSAGDDGATGGDDNVDPSKFWDKPTISWPASDPYILAVGGTTLTLKDSSGDYGNETVWNDNGATGGGLSVIYGEPSYQKSVQNQALFNGRRGIPDIAFPAENFSLYETADFGDVGVKWPHWTVIGGTSASSPSWAGLIAIADQISAQAGGGALGYIHPGLYSLQGQGFHDITQGDNSYVGVQGYSAQTGYDLASGWGTPIADQLLPALVQAVQQAGNKP
jgi:subtilase family serine protease